MTWEDVGDYLVPAIKALYQRNYAKDAYLLEGTLGWNEYGRLCRHEGDSYTPINPKYRQQLLAIANAGSNANTILKIILIKKEHDHDHG